MLISFEWLKHYVKLPDSVKAEEIAEKLKMSTVEVEGLKRMGENLENIVIGKILKEEKHPQADKLKVCVVDAGDEKYNVVCGGSNVREGMYVAFAKIGAKVKWHGEGDLVTLEKATIRGVESSGMICGADEIGLLEMFPKQSEKEIVEFKEKKLKTGIPIADYLNLNDVVLEIDNKSLSNRPDLWGHYGLGREVAALNNREVKPYKVGEIKGSREKQVKVEVGEQKACPRYMAVVVDGVKVTESPEWMKKRLIAVGLRPINLIVDITNYVMLDLGQPLHAFDGKELLDSTGNYSIKVRFSKSEENFATLDEKERKLPEQTLLICSDKEPIALAGIMGGLKSGINSETSTVVFEAANFDAATIRKTSSKLGLRTDSSARFEKGLDPNLCEVALKRAVELLKENCKEAKVVSEVIDVSLPMPDKTILELPADFSSNYLGVEVPAKNFTTILERLGFQVKKAGKFYNVITPSWRLKDIKIPEDIVEEVARVNGYQNISGSLPTFPISPPLNNNLRVLENKISDILVKELAYTEVYNYSFVSDSQIKKIGDDPQKYLELDNPLSKEKPFIRRSLLPNLLGVIENNSVQKEEVSIFEIGQIFEGEHPGFRASENGGELLPRQDTHFTALSYCKKDHKAFKKIREVMERLGDRLNFSYELNEGEVSPWVHPGRNAQIMIDSIPFGYTYELHPKVVRAHGLEGRVGVIEINLSLLSEKLSLAGKSIESLSEFPEVNRDLAFVINKDVSHKELVEVFKSSDPLLKKVELFDVYEGSAIGENKKSMAFHLTYMDKNKTLTTEEVNSAEQKIKEKLKDKWHVEFR